MASPELYAALNRVRRCVGQLLSGDADGRLEVSSAMTELTAAVAGLEQGGRDSPGLLGRLRAGTQFGSPKRTRAVDAWTQAGGDPMRLDQSGLLQSPLSSLSAADVSGLSIHPALRSPSPAQPEWPQRRVKARSRHPIVLRVRCAGCGVGMSASRWKALPPATRKVIVSAQQAVDAVALREQKYVCRALADACGLCRDRVKCDAAAEDLGVSVMDVAIRRELPPQSQPKPRDDAPKRRATFAAPPLLSGRAPAIRPPVPLAAARSTSATASSSRPPPSLASGLARPAAAQTAGARLAPRGAAPAEAAGRSPPRTPSPATPSPKPPSPQSPPPRSCTPPSPQAALPPQQPLPPQPPSPSSLHRPPSPSALHGPPSSAMPPSPSSVHRPPSSAMQPPSPSSMHRTPSPAMQPPSPSMHRPPSQQDALLSRMRAFTAVPVASASVGGASADGDGARPDQLMARPVWQTDDSWVKCGEMDCAVRFGLLHRRHHCRACGYVYCNVHASHRLPLPHLGYSQPERVCASCFEKLKPA
eukprot:TRINITY_DN1938_c0_g1_i2.p1 TRINITY_DN1938_c0_g1~~TRINITY_DN1938_c0_g1_i2.p1  ORF type:complete len:545 (+),score=159.32 TRINITY_DN1938_c0_g1_i2:47-1636(+)